MAGSSLILSAILCLSCNCTFHPPTDIIELNTPNLSLNESSNHCMSLTESESEVESESDSIRNKREYIRGLREWINGRHLVIATIEDYPLSYTKLLDNGKRIGKGISFQAIDFLQEKFNFTYEVILPEDNVIGSKNDYEKSLIKILNESKADLAAAFIPQLSETRSFIHYSSTTLDEGEWIMVMKRPKDSASGSGLMAPFDFWVWILILISLFAVGPIIYLLTIARNNLTGDFSQKQYSIGHCAWFVYGALMKQGSVLSPIADSTRLLFATWWIFITILTSFYTANLTAFLTLSKFTLPYNTISDILFNNKHFVTIRGGGVEYAIRITNESLSILNKMVTSNRVIFSTAKNDSSNLETYVEKSSYVLVRDRPAINHALYKDYRYRKTLNLNNEKLHCPFAMAKQPLLTKKRSFAYPIGTNLSDLLDPELLNLVESGIIKHLLAQDLPNAEICPQDLGGTERQLRNSDLMMTYYIMITGFVIALVIFTVEMICRLARSSGYNLRWFNYNTERSFLKTRNIFRNSKSSLVNHETNVSPPPPYQSIFRNKIGSRKSGTNYNNSFSRNNYDSEFRDDSYIWRVINGRDYIVVKSSKGQNQLIPVRVPSAALFQYSY